ncbi:GIY-YIG nuclease family protein [Bdellovibrio bacteriovorus]|uniref:GIY-YIG nuclease family protein n=1 Tax=Bdellovibrio bacteriovorus TaxID=959 RepID=UPI0035A67B54
MSLKNLPVLFLDLQTTGAKPDTANILEMAWGSKTKKLSYLVQQPEGESIPRRIQYITGIFEEDMDEAQRLSDVLKVLKDFIAEHVGLHPVAVIHFAQFEKPFLLDAYEKIQEEMPFSILCTHEIAKRLFPNLPTRGIKGLAGYFGFPSGELKRGDNHVQATEVIWNGLADALETKGITSLETLQQWLQETPKAARVKYEYPLPKEKRLSLPKQPGIYRMISRWGEVLYVGKATSLHDRVNSYFRGQKNRDTRKLEMLTQVWDLHVTPVSSPLEAALLETDEIKRLDPPYNVSLKVGARSMAFFNRDFTSVSHEHDEEHCIGPFSNSMVLDSMLKLNHSLTCEEFDENMFYEPIDAELLKDGFELFCQRHEVDKLSFTSMRSILALGLSWVRGLNEEDDVEEDIETEESEVTATEASSPSEGDEDVESEEELEVELTAEDIADKFERHFIRAARAYLRTKKLTRLLNVDIQFELKSPVILKIRQGNIVHEDSPITAKSWKNLSIETYDRMTVLYTELEKLRAQDCNLKIHKIYLNLE